MGAEREPTTPGDPEGTVGPAGLPWVPDGGPVFEQHLSPMLLITPEDQRIVAANAAAAHFYGWSRDQLTSMVISDINVLSPAELEGEIAAARAQERSYFAFRHRRADGTIQDVEVYSTPIAIDGRTVLSTVIHEATERHRAIHALHESEAFARAIVDFAPVGIAVADLQGHIVRANDALAQITGRDVDELVGLHYRDLTAPQDRADTHRAAAELHADQRHAYRLEKRYLRPDGTTVEVEASSTLVRDSRGTPQFQLGVVRDLSEQRKVARNAERAANRLALTMEAVQDGIFIVDPSWRVTFVNRRFEELLGVTAEEVLERELWDAFPAAVGGGFEQAYRSAFASGAPQTVVEYYPPTGQWYEARAHPSVEGLVIYFSDVTERMEYQQRLERIAGVERANADRLRQLDHTKTAFLTAVSHELRTPLAVVSGLAETLTRLRGQIDDEVRQRIEDGLLHHSRRLTGLLDELLDIDRLSRGTLQIDREEVDVAELVRDGVAGSPVAHRSVVEAPDAAPAWVDGVQFQHLLGNLLTNAHKYAPEGEVQVRLEEVAADRLRLTVADEGPGIPATERERVFEPFVRLDDDHPQPGTGVGLTLVAEFARLHGGEVWIDGGSGTTVVVDIPRSAGSGNGEAAASAPSS